MIAIDTTLLVSAHRKESEWQARARKCLVDLGKVYDARIAAVCLDHGVAELWTADRDFSLFPNEES